MSAVKPHNERQIVQINDILIWADEFAWDGCHKIYIVTDQQGRDDLEGYGYNFFPIDELRECWDLSCSLRFISSANLDATYVPQFPEYPVEISVTGKVSK